MVIGTLRNKLQWNLNQNGNIVLNKLATAKTSIVQIAVWYWSFQIQLCVVYAIIQDGGRTCEIAMRFESEVNPSGYGDWIFP